MNIFSFFKKEEPKKEIKPIIPEPKKISVTMPDGTVQEYSEHFMITDGNCVVCMGKFYHTSLDCESLKWEKANSDSDLKGTEIKAAKKQGIVYCQDCSRDMYLHKKGEL